MTGTDLDHVGALLPMSVTDARDTMAVYQDICRAVLTPADVQGIGDREFVKRSGFQKLAVAYGLSTTIIELTVDRYTDGTARRAHAIVRATHKTGRSAEGDGACEISERRFQSRGGREKPEHDLRATATTRATNRAISNLIAFGAMSAEEIETDAAPAPSVGPLNQRWEIPVWATATEGDELANAAAAMVNLVAALGIPDGERAAVVRALGAAIRAECDDTIPLAVTRTIYHLRDLTNVAADPPNGAVETTEPTNEGNPTNG